MRAFSVTTVDERRSTCRFAERERATLCNIWTGSRGEREGSPTKTLNYGEIFLVANTCCGSVSPDDLATHQTVEDGIGQNMQSACAKAHDVSMGRIRGEKKCVCGGGGIVFWTVLYKLGKIFQNLKPLAWQLRRS